MNDQSETERSSTSSHWFGLDRLRLSNEEQAIDVTIGAESHWDRSHLRRLRQSGDLPGMVPIIDSDFSADGKPFAVTPAIEAPTLRSLTEAGDLDWVDGACITEAAARAAYEAHLRGLFHGALSPEDVYVIDDDVAIGGVGLGLGGTPPADRGEWVAPEVREGAEPTERSDVYSLGKILESSLGEALDTVPRSIRRLIMWSSSDTPEARPPSAMEFASILAEGLGEDRQVYGPAFIPTAGASELASQASSAVSNHTPSETAQSTASGLGMGAGMVGAGTAAAGAAAFMGNNDDTAEIAEEGFSVSEPDTAEVDPGVSLDDDVEVEYQEPSILDNGEDVETDVEVNSIETIAAETGDHTISETETDREYAAPAAAQTVDLDETYVPRQRRNRAGLVIGAILGVGLAVIAWGLLNSGDNEDDLATADSDASTEVAETNDGADAEETDVELSASTTEASTATSAAAAAAADEDEAEAVTTPTTAAPTTTVAPTTTTTEAPPEPEPEAELGEPLTAGTLVGGFSLANAFAEAGGELTDGDTASSVASTGVEFAPFGPFNIDVGEESIALDWNEAPDFDELERVLAAGESDQYTFAFDDPVFAGIIAAADETQSLVPGVSQPDDNTVVVDFGEGSTFGDGQSALIVLTPAPEEGPAMESLPVTGVETNMIASVGVAFILLGIGLTAVSRRRELAI